MFNPATEYSGNEEPACLSCTMLRLSNCWLQKGNWGTFWWTFSASGLLMLKLRRGCGQTKRQASQRPEKHYPGPRRVSQHAASPASHACAAPLFLCSKGGLNSRGSLPKLSAAITGARKCYRCGRVSLTGAAISIIFVVTKVLQRGPPSKELQIQELRVQKLQKKETLTSRVQKQRHDGATQRKQKGGDTCSEIGSTQDLPQQKQGPKRHGTLDSNSRRQQRPLRNGDANMTKNTIVLLEKCS